MEQFSLEKYLANPERKIVTRDRREVRIICTDMRGSNLPILGLVKNPETLEEKLVLYNSEGRAAYMSRDLDLFFADGDVCKHTAWINLREDPDNLPDNPFALFIYSTAKEAQEAAKYVEDYNRKQGEEVKYRQVQIVWEDKA